jgi:hypothetical protein
MADDQRERVSKSEKMQKDARRRYVSAYLRVARQAIDEVGILLSNGHIDENTAIDMIAEVRELYF